MSAEERSPVEGLSDEDRELLAHLLASEAPGVAPAMARRSEREPTPLSLSQHQLWVLDQIRPGDPAYHLSVAFQAVGHLDLIALADALSDIVARHEILRTTFPVVDDEPRQVVQSPAPVPIEFTDLNGRDQAAVAEAARQEARVPFDLSRRSLFRARVLQLSGDRHVIILTMHHIVSDGWSMDVLYRELGVLYDAHRNTQRAALAPLQLQYGDFAAWQRDWLRGEELDRLIGYWRKRLDGISPLELPVDRRRAAVPDTSGGQEIVRLNGDAVASVDAFARGERVTRFMALFGAFAVLLSRYGGTRDVVVGSPIAGRDRPEVAPLIGYFVNLLPFRTTLGADTTFRGLVHQVRDTTLAAYEHQDLPLDMLVDSLGIEKSTSGNPVFNVTLSAQDVLVRPLELTDLRLEPLELTTERARFDLEAHILDDPDGLRVSFVYSTALFDAVTIRRMLGHYATLLRACLAEPDRPVLDHALLSEAERHESLVVWNETERSSPPTVRLPALVRERAVAHPKAPAIVDGTRRLTYGELDRRSSQWAHWLLRNGVRAESRVGVLFERSADLVVTVLAVLKAGAAYVPLDPGLPPARLAHLTGDAGVDVILVNSCHRHLCPESGVRVVCVDRDEDTRSCPEDPPDVDIAADQLAYVIYTSGSTGMPKGVSVPHVALENLVHWHNRAFRVTASDRATLVASVGFDASVWELWPYLAAGACVHIMDEETRAAPQRLWRWLDEAGITVAFLPTPLAEAALREGVPTESTLRVLLTGGDRLAAGLDGPWPFTLVNNYGPTESAVVSTSGTVEPRPAEQSVPTIGRAIDNVRVYVLDAGMTPLPVGIVGELYIGGQSLARGYLGRPGHTADRFVPDPFADVAGGRLYRTGDVVRWRADGTLDFVGRRDFQVKIRGHRIELGEIEAALLRLPGVHAAVASVRDSGGQRKLVGHVVPKPATEVDVEELRERLKPALPAYMVPAALVSIPALPLTTNGKVDRNALPEPVYERGLRDAGTPRTPVETTLAQIWSDVLRLQQVGVHDNFFDVGGDSVLSIQIASRAAKAGLRLSPRMFFEYQTIAELATVTESQPATAAPQGRVVGPVPLTPMQRWFLDQRQPVPDHFCQSVLLDVAAGVTLAVLRAGVGSIVAHHDVLRSRFTEADGVWSQEVSEADPAYEWIDADLSALPDEQHAPAIERVADRLRAGLRLVEGRLLGVASFSRGAGESSRLLIVIHHLVVDAVSWRILIEDLHAALEGHRARQPVLLPPKTTSFQGWAQCLRDQQAAGTLRSEQAFWAAQAAVQVGVLPLDDPTGQSQNTVGRSERVEVSLTPAETDALLREVSRACGARPNEVLLAAVANALQRWSGSRAVRLDIEGHGREDAFPGIDLSRTVGWLTVLHPVTVTPATHGDLWATVQAVRDVLREVPRGGLGYGLLHHGGEMDAAAPDFGSGTQADVSFNYLGQVDRAAPDSGIVRLVAGSVGQETSPRNRRPYLFEVNARVAGGCLEVSWTFCPAAHRRSTVDRLAADALASVRVVLAEARSVGRPALHAADFPLADLEEGQAAQLSARMGDAFIEDIYPLTPLQLGMLVSSLARPGSGVFVTQMELVIEGDLLAAPFREAWRRLQEWHPILRTACCDVGGGEFRQVVLAQAPLPWTEVDLSQLPAAEADARLRALLDEDRYRGFELSEAPMMRLALVEVRPSRYHLVWTHHHALLDGWSVVMLLEELVLLYEAGVEGRDLAPETRPGYREFTEWLRKRPPEAGRRFWSHFLEGFVRPTVLAVDQAPRVRAASAAQMAEIEHWIDGPGARALGDAAARHRVTLNTVLQGAWALLLSRYSGERDVVFGTAVAGRPADLPGVERMVGLFLNGVPMRVVVEDDAPMTAWLAAIQKAHVEVRQHEQDALQDIQRWSDVPAGQPLFETTVAFENYPVAASLDVATRRMGIVDFRLTAHTSAALHLRIVPGERVRLMLAYDRGRFDDGTAVAMLDQLEAILFQFSAKPETPVGQVSLATPAESMDGDRVGAGMSWTRGAVHEQIVERMRVAGDAPAIAEEAGDLSYAQLDDRSNRVAHALVAAGVQQGDVVAMYAPRGAELVAAMLGTLRAGAAFTILDPTYPVARLIDHLEIADVRTVFKAAALRDTAVFDTWAGASAQRQVLSPDDLPVDARLAPICVSAGPDDLAYVAFTSGSSGRPKAIAGRHASLAHYAWWLRDRFRVTEADRVSMLSALSHDPLLRDVFPPLQVGATLCIPDGARFDRPGALGAWVSTQRVTIANLTPSMAELMLVGDRPEPVAALRLVLFVGEALSLVALERFRRWAGAATCVNLYGATESQQALAHFVVPPDGLTGTNDIVPVGVGIAGVRLAVRSVSRQPVGVGEVGEIWIQSRLLARDYLNDVEQTIERFVDDPFGPGTGRAFRTGDRGRALPTGDVLVLGRADDLVKIRGFRVEPREVHGFLERQPDVREAAVMPVRDPSGEMVLGACVAGSGTPSELRRRMRTQFPDYLVPARITRVERLPRTATGKVDRQAIAALLASEPEAAESYVGPRTPAEARLVGLWQELLGGDRIGAFDSFFDLGGHSILAARLVANIREAFGVDLRIADVFERPRVAELAGLLAMAVADEAEVVRQLAEEIGGLSPEAVQALLDEAGESGTESGG